MGPDIREIEVARIRPNVRMVYDTESIQEIERCIRDHGQREPIRICFVYDSFRILDGEKRWRAFKRLGKRTISAVIE